ncbi:hypothetical protein [Sphingomonas sp. LB2R24]|uniref:hypothetical protein n=1 Tax=Sphingomonas sorbitolis TaxID=3096165 RepID=UPI002FCAD723
MNMPFSVAEFKEAMDRIVATPKIDTSTQEGVDKLRFSPTVPIDNFTEIEPNLYFGTYQGIYTGHTYQNTAKGEIPYNSASLRTFYFMAYWSKPKGRVYVATQYLGQFGDYTGLKNTISRAFSNKKGVESHSFRNNSTAFQKVKAKEISVEYMKSGSDAGTANSFGNVATIVLKRSGDGNDFAEATRKRLFSIFDGPKDKIKTEVAKILRENRLTSIADSDVINCTVLAEIDGAERRYHFINDSNYATQFHVSVGMDLHGHPEPTQLQTAMRNMLMDEILAKSENV